MFQQMRDGPPKKRRDGLIADAERAVGSLAEMSIDLRACAVLGPDGELLAASDPGEWGALAASLWSAAEVQGRPRPIQVHVATEGGEVFALRTASASAVAVSARFALASLMFCDLRAALRGLDGPGSENGGAD